MCCEFTISDPPGIDFKEEFRMLHNLIYRDISIWGFSVKSDFLFIKCHELPVTMLKVEVWSYPWSARGTMHQ